MWFERDENLGFTDELDPEVRLRLILWLSTPPQEAPVKWADLDRRHPAAQAREAQLELILPMWRGWVEGTIQRDLQRPLAVLGRAERAAWLEQAQQFFSGFGAEHPALVQTRSDQARIDVVAGYGALAARLLAEKRASRQVPRLRLAANAGVLKGRRSLASAIANSIATRSGLGVEVSGLLGTAISLSLPAHPEVLPTVAVDVEPSGCWLRSEWSDPLAR